MLSLQYVGHAPCTWRGRLTGEEFLTDHGTQTVALCKELYLGGKKISHKVLFAELVGLPGRPVFTFHLVNNFDGAAVGIEFWMGSPLHPIAFISNFLNALRRSLR